MPRNPAGIYTLPAGYEAVTGETIQASQHNPPLEDIAAALTGSLPRNGTAPMLGALAMSGFKVTGIADGTVATDAITKAQLDALQATLTAAIAALSSNFTPPGTIAFWPFNTSNIPAGWLEMNGQAVSRTTYSALFSAIGGLYGAGNGSTTFSLPDVRGEFPRFWSNGSGSDPGRSIGSKQAEAIQSHNHGLSDPGHAHSYNAGDNAFVAGGGGFASNSPGGKTTGAATTGISISPVGGPETRPRNIAFLGIIKF